MYDFDPFDPIDPKQEMEEKTREADPFAAEDPFNPFSLHSHSIDPLWAKDPLWANPSPQAPLGVIEADPLSASPMVADQMDMNQFIEPDAIFGTGEQFSGMVEESVEVEDSGLPERDVWDETEAKEIADLEEDRASGSQMDADDIWFQQEASSFIEPETPISERAIPLPYYDDVVVERKAPKEESDESLGSKLKSPPKFDESAAIAREIQAKERACMENYHREVIMKRLHNIGRAMRTGDKGRMSKARLTAKARFDRAKQKGKRQGLFGRCINCGRRLKDGVCPHCDKRYCERESYEICKEKQMESM